MSVGLRTPPAGYSAWSTSFCAAHSTRPSCVALWREGFLLDIGKGIAKVSAWKMMETEKRKGDMLCLNILPIKSSQRKLLYFNES